MGSLHFTMMSVMLFFIITIMRYCNVNNSCIFKLLHHGFHRIVIYFLFFFKQPCMMLCIIVILFFFKCINIFLLLNFLWYIEAIVLDLVLLF